MTENKMKRSKKKISSYQANHSISEKGASRAIYGRVRTLKNKNHETSRL